MTEQEIKDTFNQLIHQRGRGTKAGLTNDQVYNYKRTPPTIGTMLEVLWLMDQLEMKIE
jgi:hypothetical protein